MKRRQRRKLTMRGVGYVALPIVLLVLLCSSIPAQSASIVINEFLADPPSGLAGDANGDGTRYSLEDEFVEIVNASSVSINISGWALEDGTGPRHVFPLGTSLPSMSAIVVFGGGTPTGYFGGSLVQIASSGSLSLNNTGDSILLYDGLVYHAAVSYGEEGNADQSLTIDPDIYGSGFERHSLAAGSGGALFSPGTMIDGSPFSAPVVPIPGSILLLGSGLSVLVRMRRNG